MDVLEKIKNIENSLPYLNGGEKLNAEMLINDLKGMDEKITCEIISKIVCDYFNMPIDLLHAKTRKREIVQARQIAMFFSKSLTNDYLADIGSKIGGKDHATVLHACKTVDNLIETDKRFRRQIEEIEKKIKPYE